MGEMTFPPKTKREKNSVPREMERHDGKRKGRRDGGKKGTRKRESAPQRRRGRKEKGFSQIKGARRAS